MTLLLHLLRTESEDNAVLCMKVIIDLHRTYSRPPPPPAPSAAGTEPTPDSTVTQIESSVDEFLEIVADLFKNMGSVVEETFKESTPAPGGGRATRSNTAGGSANAASGESNSLSPAGGPPPIEGEGGAAGNQPVVYAPAMRSFKLLQDCPASIVFIFQTYRPMVNKAITIFVPLVFEVSFRLSPSHLVRAY
jgi:transformation/transcription domain-associated protein